MYVVPFISAFLEILILLRLDYFGTVVAAPGRANSKIYNLVRSCLLSLCVSCHPESLTDSSIVNEVDAGVRDYRAQSNQESVAV